MKLQHSLPFILTLLLTGCLSIPQVPEQQSATRFVVTSDHRQISTSTAISSTPTSVVIEAQECLSIYDTVPASESLAGYLVAKSKTDSQQNAIYAINLNNYIKSTLAIFDDERTIGFGPTIYTISPDRKWFVYIQKEINNQKALYLGDVENNSKKVLVWNDTWSEIVFWIKNDKLFIPPSSDYQGAIALNPFTGERDKLQSEFPSGLNFSFPRFYYNSTLSRAVYASGDNYVLWSAEANTDLWIQPTFAPYLAPKWSPLGDRVAMIARNEVNGLVYDEFILVDQDGIEIDVSDLLLEIQGNLSNQIGAVEWSPDNQHIAFSLEYQSDVNKPTNSTLFILDSISGQAVNLCIPVRSDSNIVWSPDGNQLIVETNGQNNQKDSLVVLVDIKKGWAAQIDKNLTPLGWMVAP